MPARTIVLVPCLHFRCLHEIIFSEKLQTVFQTSRGISHLEIASLILPDRSRAGQILQPS
jgi:hypothetical protein